MNDTHPAAPGNGEIPSRCIIGQAWPAVPDQNRLAASHVAHEIGKTADSRQDRSASSFSAGSQFGRPFSLHPPRQRRTVRLTVKGSIMKPPTHFGIQRLLLGWVIFLGGLLPLQWLHTFTDRAAHRAIGPMFLLLWIALLVCVRDGCKMFTPRLRIIFVLVQVAASVAVCMLFVLHLINQPV